MAGVSPYETALDLKRTKPDWVPNPDDNARVQAYNTYWDIFTNVKDAFKVVLRDDTGDEISRRFVPAARTIIEATNRYLAKNPVVTPRPLAVGPDGSQVEADEAQLVTLMDVINNLFEREEFFTKFASMKRWMLIRGDGMLHVTANDQKEEGQRLRIVEVDPGSYFPIYDPLDVDRVTGVYLVTLVKNDKDELVAQRQSYTRTETGTIMTKLDFFERDKWDDRWPLGADDLKTVDVPARFAGMEALLEGFELPSQITTIPVYHYRNRRGGGLQFGLSELQGIETLLAGIHQTATDEDITIAQTGIGIFVTSSGTPKDSQGNDVDWVIAPASVLELESKDDFFERVKGVETVQPLLDHMGMLESQARETTGTPDIAVGKVEVQVAESGVALAIQMSPTLAKNQETEMELKGRTEQLLYDLVNMWLPSYEGYAPAGIKLQITFDDPLPPDRAAIMKEILDMVTAKVIPIAFAQKLIKERLGYDIPSDALNQMAAENQQMLDSVGGRLGQEEAGGDPSAGAV